VLLDFLDVDSFAARISRDGFNIGGTMANGRVRFVRRSSCIRTARLPSSSSAVGVRIAFGLESLQLPLTASGEKTLRGTPFSDQPTIPFLS
jgi:hypothetical protein